MNLTNYCKAGFPLLSIQTEEVKRCVQSISTDAPFTVNRWNAVDGIRGEYKKIPDLIEYSTTLSQSILILENFNWFFEDKGILQVISNNLELYKNNQVTLVIVGKDKINPFFDKAACTVDFRLPVANDFLPMILNFAGQIGQNIALGEQRNIAENCLGLSYDEAENAIALEIVKSGKITVEAVYRAKEGIINNSGLMQIQKPESLENIGGLEPLKKYFEARLQAYQMGNEHMPKLKAILLVGTPGCGKSLFSKALASVFNRLLISANINNLKDSLVGNTEKRTKQFTEIVDSIGDCIVHLDEIDRMFSNGQGDSGTSKGQLGAFLTWMNDRSSSAIIVATSNNLSDLPAEFLRSGRWDCIFFVDYPNLEERKIIIEIMNRKHHASLPFSLAEKLESWSGAEIEQLAKDSHFDDIDYLVKNQPVLWKTNRDKIEKIKELAKNYRRANGKPVTDITQIRKIGG